jgi:hypothetical protein
MGGGRRRVDHGIEQLVGLLRQAAGVQDTDLQ